MNEAELTRRRTISYWRAVMSVLDSVHPLRDLNNHCDNIQAIREKVKDDLRVIHNNIRGFLSENNSYYVVFALASHCDEIAQAYVGAFPGAFWAPLQDELFSTGDAGNLFYKYIELFRGRNDIDQVTFQTFYFCLNDGFNGRYIFDAGIRSGFMRELLSYIDIAKIPDTLASQCELTRRSNWMLPVWAYYFAIPAALYLIHILLGFIPIGSSGF